jgi:hypothetical protein
MFRLWLFVNSCCVYSMFCSTCPSTFQVSSCPGFCFIVGKSTSLFSIAYWIQMAGNGGFSCWCMETGRLVWLDKQGEILMNPLPFVLVWIQFLCANRFTGACPFLPYCQAFWMTRQKNGVTLIWYFPLLINTRLHLWIATLTIDCEGLFAGPSSFLNDSNESAHACMQLCMKL